MSSPTDWDRTFREEIAADGAVERRLLIRELVIVAIIALLLAVRATL